MAEPRFHVLGELAVRRDGREVELPGRCTQSLLGVLLLSAGEVVSDERLLELAWGGEGASRRALQCAASRLRTWLSEQGGPTCRLDHAGAGYRLDLAQMSIDASRFQALHRAGSLRPDPRRRFSLLARALREWRGPVLGGRFDWLATDPVVRSLERVRIDCACELADVALLLDRAADAVGPLSEVALAAPYDEPLQARLVRLLCASGRAAEALRQASSVRRRLADELGVQPSGEIASAISAIPHRPATTASPPAQLPSDVSDFTGRARELRRICRSILPDRLGGGARAVMVLVVTGMAGTGKSTLAVHASHLLARLFPDGQLYVDLRGGPGEPAEPHRVLGWLLGALGSTAGEVPISTVERAALYRTRLAGHRILVVLDNAGGEGEVRSLLPGTAGSAVLVTSRTSLSGLAGVGRVHLDVLPPGDAVTLLGRVAGRPGIVAEPAARQVVRLCGLLPLAVRIAGTHLRVRPWMGLDQLVTRLRDPDARLDQLSAGDLSVRGILAASYRDLAPPLRAAFRRIGMLPPAAFPATAAAAALSASPASAVRQVEALVDAGLITAFNPSPAGQPRYRVPDLMRLFARELARQEAAGGCASE